MRSKASRASRSGSSKKRDGDLGRDRLRRLRRLAEQALHVVRRDLAAHQREVRDDVRQLVEVAGPVRAGERRERRRRQRREQRRRRVAARRLAPEALDQRRDVLPARAQRRQHHRADGELRQQRGVELAFRREVAERLGAGAHQRRLVLLELGQQERETLLLDLRVVADLGAVERALARPPRAARSDWWRAATRPRCDTNGVSRRGHARARRRRGRCRTRRAGAAACGRRAPARRRAPRRAPAARCRARRATRVAARAPRRS